MITLMKLQIDEFSICKTMVIIAFDSKNLRITSSGLILLADVIAPSHSAKGTSVSEKDDDFGIKRTPF